MNITEIKARISASAGFAIPTLDLHEQKDANDVVNPDWVSHWDNEHRVRVTLHRDILSQIVANPAFNGLAVKDVETVQPVDPTKPTYRLFVIITPKIVASI